MAHFRAIKMPIRLQFRLGKRDYLVKFQLGFSLLCLFIFAVLCLLGTWQLQRYADKKRLLATYQFNMQRNPLPFLSLPQHTPLQFQRVLVSGTYLNSLTLLVQNQLYHGQLGFEVLTPLAVSGEKKLLLVDRGWIKKPAGQALPMLEQSSAPQQIKGYLKEIQEYQFILGKNILNPTTQPLVVQKIDLTEISHVLQRTFYPVILRLDATEPHGYIRDWVIVSLQPERHLGYAVQWFALAFVWLLAYFCFCCERREP